MVIYYIKSLIILGNFEIDFSTYKQVIIIRSRILGLLNGLTYIINEMDVLSALRKCEQGFLMK